MANINKVLLMGRLANTPELKHTASNIPVTSFAVAINRGFSKPGEQSVADFIDIVCWRQTAEFVAKYFTKGKPIFISGTIQTRTWQDKDGKNRKSVEVVADEVSFAEERSSANQNNGPVPTSNIPNFSSDSISANDFQELSDDDELPF